MLNKIVLWVTLSIMISLTTTSCTQNESKKSVQQRGELVVAMDVEMPGFFVLNGESYGYQYDLFKAYADYLGVNLRVISEESPTDYRKMLTDGEIDVITTLSSHVASDEKKASVHIYNTSYVLLANKSNAAKARKIKNFNVTTLLEGKQLLVSSGFKSAKAYNELLDSLKQTKIYVSSRNSFELIETLSSGEADYLICEMSEAQLGCALTRNVEQVYSFAEPVSLSALITHHGELQEDFEVWLNTFHNSEEYALLNDLYFERGIVRQVMQQGVTSNVLGGISSYDQLFKELCEKEGYDWRLISAIAYNESRFNPNITSRKGAKGLMQIMPRVARQFGASGDLSDPQHNIYLSLKILTKIEKSLKFREQTVPTERMKIVLACYNGGIGHVLDARNLARKHGGDPDSWEDVSRYLSLKSIPEYSNDEVVKCGGFNSGETTAFVDKVYKKYLAYCTLIKK